MDSKIVNESPKVALISNFEDSESRRKESQSDMGDWDRITSESQKAILSGVDPNSFLSKRESKEDPIPEELNETSQEILEIWEEDGVVLEDNIASFKGPMKQY